MHILHNKTGRALLDAVVPLEMDGAETAQKNDSIWKKSFERQKFESNTRHLIALKHGLREHSIILVYAYDTYRGFTLETISQESFLLSAVAMNTQ